MSTGRRSACSGAIHAGANSRSARGRQIGNVTAYEVNQEWAWRGKVTNLNKRRYADWMMNDEITETDIEAATDELRNALLALLLHGYTTSGYDRVVDCLADCERLADGLVPVLGDSERRPE